MNGKSLKDKIFTNQDQFTKFVNIFHHQCLMLYNIYVHTATMYAHTYISMHTY